MKKNILVLLVGLVGFSNVAWSVATCAPSSDVITIPGANECSSQPDSIQYAIYEMGLCTAAPTAPGDDVAAVLTNCTAILNNTGSTYVTIANGTTSGLSGAITRPSNGTYTHGYIRVDKVVKITDASSYANQQLGETAGNTNHCALLTAGTACYSTLALAKAAANSNVSKSLAFGQHPSISTDAVYVFTATNPVRSAYLLNADQTLADGADGAADVGRTAGSDATKYLLGVETFAAPIVITDNTSSMQVRFKVTESMNVDRRFGTTGIGINTLTLGAGPFSTELILN